MTNKKFDVNPMRSIWCIKKYDMLAIPPGERINGSALYNIENNVNKKEKV